MIRRGTTPENTFTLPFDPQPGAEFRIVYAQGEDHKENILFEITTERCKVDGRVISVRLTQEETLRFDSTPVYHDGKYATPPVKIQIGMQTLDKEVLWSCIIETTVERCLRKDGRVCDD